EAYPHILNGVRFDPKMGFQGTTRLYVHNEKDLRAEGPATPAWYSEAISNQPEFLTCALGKVEEIIYGGFPVPAAVHEPLLNDFRATQDFGALLENALLAWALGGEKIESKTEAAVNP